MICIARALDGSWVSLATDEGDAQRQIAEREPDIVKQGRYQILWEPLSKLMANVIPGVRRGLRQTLVKWDGDGPIPEDAAANPKKYPHVVEVMEGGDGIPTKTLYRRE